MWKRKRTKNGGTYWRSGDYNVICDMTGFKVKRSQCVKTWDGFLVRKQDWEARHPQDFVRGVVDRIAVPDARPEGTDVFIDEGSEVTFGSEGVTMGGEDLTW